MRGGDGVTVNKQWSRKKPREDNFTRLLQYVLQERINNAVVSVQYGDVPRPSTHSVNRGWVNSHDGYNIMFHIRRVVAEHPAWLEDELLAIFDWVDGWNKYDENPWVRPFLPEGQTRLEDYVDGEGEEDETVTL
jgi:hypothetical protein